MSSKAEWAPLNDEEREIVNKYQAKLKEQWLASLQKRAASNNGACRDRPSVDHNI